MMSEPKRNPGRMLVALGSKITQHPQLRIAQLLVSAAGVDPFYIEDDRLAELIESYPDGAPR
jgi:hypothetical protein